MKRPDCLPPKVCRGCRHTLPASDFYWRAGTGDLSSRCKPCSVARNVITERTRAARRHAQDHPLVRVTIAAEKAIRTRYPWKHDWPLAIREQVALVGLTHGRVFADRLGYGLRSRLQLVDESQCGYTWGDGHQCTETPRHRDDHRCACGQRVCRGTPKYVRRLA